MTKWRRSLNGLNDLWLNDQWCEDPTIIKESVKEFFKDRFRIEQWVHLRLDNVSFNTISCEDTVTVIKV